MWVEDINGKCVPVDDNELLQKTVSLREDFCRGPPETSDVKPFTASGGWSHRVRDRFGLNTVTVTGEAVSAEEAAATFLVGRTEEVD